MFVQRAQCSDMGIATCATAGQNNADGATSDDTRQPCNVRLIAFARMEDLPAAQRFPPIMAAGWTCAFGPMNEEKIGRLERRMRNGKRRGQRRFCLAAPDPEAAVGLAQTMRGPGCFARLCNVEGNVVFFLAIGKPFGRVRKMLGGQERRARAVLFHFTLQAFDEGADRRPFAGSKKSEGDGKLFHDTLVARTRDHRAHQLEQNRGMFLNRIEKRRARHRQQFAVAHGHNRHRVRNVGQQGDFADRFARPDEA